MRTYIYSLATIFCMVYAHSTYAGVEEILASGMPVKCGTPYVLSGEAGVPKTAASYRSSGMEHSILSNEGHFRVHYNVTQAFDNVDAADVDTNGIPDYVDACLEYLEYAYSLLVGSSGLGFDPPRPDGSLGGGPELDVYLKNMSGVYGLTTPSMQTGTTSSAYIEVDNDFTESIYQTRGLEALKVTTAHEFFHAVQFRMYNQMSFNWWMEHSSVWFEEYAWGDVNDYLAYLQFFFMNRDYPLDTRNGTYEYGAAVWAMYLAKEHGPEIIPAIWKYCVTAGSYNIASFDQVIPGGLAAALSEFATWNYFTGTRGNGIDFYPDSPMFSHMIETDASANKSPALGALYMKRLTSKYVELLFTGEWSEEDSLQISVTALNSGKHASTLILYNSPTDYSIHQFGNQSASIPFDGVWDRGILVAACGNTTGSDDYSYTYETEVIDTPEGPAPSVFALHSVYPNPFNPVTTVAFSIPDGGGTVKLTVFNVTGQKVAEIFSGWLDGGEKQLVWRPGNSLAGGSYIIRLSAPWGTRTVKSLFIK